MSNRVANMLNLRPGEGRLAALLLALSLALGCAIVFADTAANALFLTTWGARSLPYVYLAAAVIIPLNGWVFARLQQRLALPTLLSITLGLLFVSAALLRLGLWRGSPQALVFGLVLWYRLLYVLLGLVFWGLAGRLLDLRQGKRLFGLVGTGEAVARIAGYFSVPLLVGRLGTANLLLVAAASLLAGWALVALIGRQFGARLAKPTAPASAQRRAGEVWRQGYVQLILLSAALAICVYLLIDFGFAAQAQQQFRTADQLAAFFGVFFGTVNLARLGARPFLSSHLLNRYGLRAGLLALPVVLLVIAVAVAAAGMLPGASMLVFGLMAALRFGDGVLRMAVHKPAFQLLFQPLRPEQRLQAQVIADSMVEPVTMGIAGALLLLLASGGTFGTPLLAFMLLLLVLGWVAVSRQTYRAYHAALRRALLKRSLGGALDVADATTLTLVQHALRDPHVGAVVYALDVLERAQPPTLDALLAETLGHPDALVRQDVLRRIEGRTATPALAEVRRLARAGEPPVRAAAARTLCALLGSAAVDDVLPLLEATDDDLRSAAMIGLLRYGGSSGTQAVEPLLLRLVDARAASDRRLAAQVLGAARIPRGHHALAKLLHDGDPNVQRAALAAVGQKPDPELWPVVIRLLPDAPLLEAASAALVAGGSAVLPLIEAHMRCAQLQHTSLLALIRCCARIGGDAAIAVLKPWIDAGDGDVRTEVLRALQRCGYQAQGEDVAKIRLRIQAEAAEANWIRTALVDLGDDDELRLLRAALALELAQRRILLLVCLGFLYDAQALQLVQDNLAHASQEKRALALEIVDELLAPDLRGVVLAVLSDVAAPGRSRRLDQELSQPFADRAQRVQAIAEAPNITAWTRACAVHAIGALQLVALHRSVEALTDSANVLIHNTARWALARLEVPEAVPRSSQSHLNGTRPQAPTGLSRGGHSMLSLVEKVIILRTVSIFAATADDALADLATRLSDVEVAAGETIFRKGDPATSLYVIVAGEVCVHEDGHSLNRLSERDVVGELALLDGAPRVATVTAVTDTQLLRMDREPFYEVLSERGEVAHGIIRVLAGYVRARVTDVANLRQRMNALEPASRPFRNG